MASRNLDVVLPVNVAKALVAGKHASTHSLLGQKVPLRVETRGGGMFTGGGLISPSHPSKPQNAVIVGLMGSGVGYVPYDTALHWTTIAAPNPHHIHYPGVTVLVRNVSNVSPVAHHIDALGFSTTTAQQTLKSVNKSFGLIETGLGTVGGASILPDDEAWNPILDDFIDQGSTLYSPDPDVFHHRWLEVPQYLHKHPEWEDTSEYKSFTNPGRAVGWISPC